MSFDSSDEDEGVPVYKVHTPIWTSPALIALISKIEQRIMRNENLPGTKRLGFVPRKRVLSTSSLTDPPNNAPSWAMSNNYLHSEESTNTQDQSNTIIGSESQVMTTPNIDTSTHGHSQLYVL
jgi:hypothetical protein